MRFATWTILLLGGLVAPVQAQVVPSWKFTEGTSFTLENVETRQQSVVIHGKTQKSAATTTWVTRIDVLKVGDKQVVVEQSIISVAVKDRQPPAGKLNPANEAWAEKLKGSKFRFTLSSAGRVLAMEGFDEFFKKIDGPKRGWISESALRQNLEEMLGFLPEKPGAAWQRQAVESIAPFGSLKTVFQYGVAGRRDGMDVIAVTIKADYVPPKNDLGVLRVVNGTLKAEQGKGSILFDPQKGMLIRGERQLSIRGQLTLEIAPNRMIDMELVSDSQVMWRVLEK